jgi:cysteine-rich secretory family protein
MLVRLALLLALASASWTAALAPGERGQQPGAESAPLADAAVRAKLRLATGEVAKTGDAALVERLRSILVTLGDSEAELEGSQREWDRLVARPRTQRSVRTASARRLQRELAPLAAQLATEEEPRRTQLAWALLAVDSGLAEANAVLGRELDTDGVWRTSDERAWKRGAEAATAMANAAAVLEFEVEHGTSENPCLEALGGDARFVRAAGVEVHGRLSAESLERILRQALRAAAYSRGLLFGRVDLPSTRRRLAFVLLDDSDQRDEVLEEAQANRGLGVEEHEQILALDLRSFFDARGWRTACWRSEADFEALVLWDLVETWIGREAAPCLRMGHLNGVCLRFLNTSAPLVAWSETSIDGVATSERSRGVVDDPRRRQTLWRAARQSFWGTRAWMINAVRTGRDPPFARTLLDQDGKVRDAILLKATLVCEQLQVEGRLWELVEGTRGKGASVAAFEEALGVTMPELEERWRRWLDPLWRTGVVQELEGPPTVPAGEGPFAPALLALNQARADALLGQGPEIPVVVEDPELSRAAEAHARYLTLNPEQKGGWPAMHEELAGKPGFTPEGALSASRALIAFEGEPKAALHSWMATFYHRLPLLEPGLFGVGIGQSEEVIVLDARSLVLAPWKEHVVVWPLPDAEKVPRRFRPEFPNPVPGEAMAALGYPVTVQLTFPEETHRVKLTLELFEGRDVRGTPVPGHFLSPDAPLQPELAPPNAWGLIPRTELGKNTRYTARARWNGVGVTEKVWTFMTGE